MQIKTKIKEYK